MAFLAIETSQRSGGVALRLPDGSVAVERLGPSSRHDDGLVPAIERVVRGADLLPHDVDAVGVSLGPGGFTGLRVAVSVAKMLAETLGAVTIGVPSALVVAERHDGAGPIIVALASKGETFWSTRLARRAGVWTIDGTPAIEGQALELAGIRAVLADRHLPGAARARITGAGVAIVEPRFEPDACLCVAERLLASGQATDPLTLAPIYPRPPEAVIRWRERHGPGVT